MKVLIANASKHGGTHEIAERIGRVLQSHHFAPDVVDVTTGPSLDPYDAVVLCSAVYYGHWMKPAAEFVRAPYGDFRDWAAIDAWASRIAQQLTAAEVMDGRA
jgi:menaquinone-dependent protoporphyrinogen oxidase